MNAGNPVNTHFSLKNFKHLSNLCKILLFWVSNLIFKFFIKLTHQINTVINCSSSIIIHILMIGKDLNCLPSSNTSLCSSQCRRSHTCLKFHKFIICSVIRTGFFIPLLMIAAITFFLKVPFVIFLIFCTTSAALALIFDFITKKRNLKTLLALTWVKREVSERGRFRGKNSSLIRHCWSRCDHKF